MELKVVQQTKARTPPINIQLGINFLTCPNGKQSMESVWRGEALSKQSLESRCTILLSTMYQHANIFIFILLAKAGYSEGRATS